MDMPAYDQARELNFCLMFLALAGTLHSRITRDLQGAMYGSVQNFHQLNSLEYAGGAHLLGFKNECI